MGLSTQVLLSKSCLDVADVAQRAEHPMSNPMGEHNRTLKSSGTSGGCRFESDRPLVCESLPKVTL